MDNCFVFLESLVCSYACQHYEEIHVTACVYMCANLSGLTVNKFELLANSIQLVIGIIKNKTGNFSLTSK